MTAAADYCFTTVNCGLYTYKAVCMHDSEDGVSSEEGPTCSMKSVTCIVNTLANLSFVPMQNFPLSSCQLLANKHKMFFVADSSHFYFNFVGDHLRAYIRAQYRK